MRTGLPRPGSDLVSREHFISVTYVTQPETLPGAVIELKARSWITFLEEKKYFFTVTTSRRQVETFRGWCRLDALYFLM